MTGAKSVSLNGRDVSFPAGKVVVGSIQLNRMVFDPGVATNEQGKLEPIALID